MIRFNNQNLKKAVENHPDSQVKIAVLSGSSETTLKRVLKGETDLNLSSLDKLAGYVGLDVEIRFVKRAIQAETAGV